MRLSMSMLCKYLQKYDPQSFITEDSAALKGVRFLSDQISSFSLEYVYAGAAEGFFQDASYKDKLLLTNGRSQLLCTGTDSEEILNDILSAFEFYNSIEQKLIYSASDHAPIQKFAEIAGDLLAGATLIFDIEGNLIANAISDQSAVFDDIRDIIEKKYLPFSIIAMTFKDRSGGISHDLSDSPQWLTPEDPAAARGSVCMYLTRDGERVGFLMFFPANENEVISALCLEEMLARHMIEAEEFTSPDSPLQTTSGILRSLIEGIAVTGGIRDRLTKFMGNTDGYLLLVYRNVAVRNYTLNRLMHRDLEAANILFVSGEYDGNPILLIRREDRDAVLAFFAERLTRLGFSMGISMPFLDYALVPNAYKQACFALGDKDEPGIRSCLDLAFSYLLQLIRQDNISHELLHPALSALQYYDEAQGTELKNTLIMYLHHLCSQRETAQALHIHLNTLKYRIHRIEELTGINFKDPRELLYLNLSIRLDEP